MNPGQDSILAPITSLADLQRLANSLLGEAFVAVDSESNSLFAYREQVCLIQFSTMQADFMVDPLALDDLSPLTPVFSDEKIEKVFHAAEYDLLCLRRDFGFEMQNLFDTMIASRILGRTEVGLGSMLEAEFGIGLDKRHQRANWGERPLQPALLEYARQDTRYLIPLRDRLRGELEHRGLLPLAEEDFKRMAAGKANGNTFNLAENKTTDPWRVSGSYDLEPQQAAVLLELCRYRDRAACALNRPLFKVINDKTLLSIAVEAPKNLRELSQLQGMSPVQIRRHGKELLQAVQRGLQAEPIRPPRPPRPEEGFLERLEALREWRKQTAQEMGVMSDVILPRDLVSALAQRNPASAEELGEVLAEVPWRLEHFGEQILRALNKAGVTDTRRAKKSGHGSDG